MVLAEATVPTKSEPMIRETQYQMDKEGKFKNENNIT